MRATQQEALDLGRLAIDRARDAVVVAEIVTVLDLKNEKAKEKQRA